MGKSKTLLLAAVLVAGCGAVPPRVSYSLYAPASSASEDRRGYLFRHRRAVLVVEIDSSAQFTVAATPWELTPDNRYAPLHEIVGADDLASTTSLKVVYLPNTKFIDELSVATKDNVAEAIGKVGDLVKAAIPLLASAKVLGEETETFTSTKIDPMVPGSDQWRRDPLNPGFCLRLRDVAVESDLTLDAYMAARSGSWARTFPLPACATGIVDIGRCPRTGRPEDAKVQVSLRVNYAHHTNVIPLPLPSSGAVRMHAVCGASVTHADKQDRTSLIEHLQALITKATEIHNAWESKGAAAKPEAKPAAKPEAKK